MIRETSIEAYRKIREDGSLSRRRMEVYESLLHCAPATGNTVLQYLQSIKHVRFQNQSNITTRLGELRDMGVIEEVDTVIDPVTQHRATRYRLTNEDTPRPLKRRETLGQKCKRLERELIALKASMCEKCRQVEIPF